MNKISIGQLAQFQRDASLWFGQDSANPTQFRNQKNVESPLGECILRIMPHVELALKEWVDLGLKYNKDVADMKAEYAEKATIMENSAMPNHVSTNYEYTGVQLKERNRVINGLWEQLIAERKALEVNEVEIETFYVKNVPPANILPPNFITSFRGLVINPEYDSNKSPLAIK